VNAEARFWLKVVKTPGCHFWVGAIADDGYGRFHVDGTVVRPHRWLLEQSGGLVDPADDAMHDCDETLCVRIGPGHVVAGPHALNLADMARRGRGAGPWHRGRGDVRGQHGRALAIRTALSGGYDADRLAAAMAEGDPDRHWPRLFNDQLEPMEGTNT
jgi:hypothetical protein